MGKGPEGRILIAARERSTVHPRPWALLNAPILLSGDLDRILRIPFFQVKNSGTPIPFRAKLSTARSPRSSAAFLLSFPEQPPPSTHRGRLPPANPAPLPGPAGTETPTRPLGPAPRPRPLGPGPSARLRGLGPPSLATRPPPASNRAGRAAGRSSGQRRSRPAAAPSPGAFPGAVPAPRPPPAGPSRRPRHPLAPRLLGLRRPNFSPGASPAAAARAPTRMGARPQGA